MRATKTCATAVVLLGGSVTTCLKLSNLLNFGCLGIVSADLYLCNLESQLPDPGQIDSITMDFPIASEASTGICPVERLQLALIAKTAYKKVCCSSTKQRTHEL